VATEDDVRRIALSLPETIEKPWFGTPGFRVKDKGFLRIRSEAEGGLVVWVSDLGEKEALLASEPDKFFTTPHYDGHPTVLVNLPCHRRRRAARDDHRGVAHQGAQAGATGV
jgi:hypothetical protein